MSSKRLLALCLPDRGLLAACSSGDITLAPTNISAGGGGGGGGGGTNPCATYTGRQHDAHGHLRRHELHLRRERSFPKRTP